MFIAWGKHWLKYAFSGWAIASALALVVERIVLSKPPTLHSDIGYSFEVLVMLTLIQTRSWQKAKNALKA